jgi:hypothetical protein
MWEFMCKVVESSGVSGVLIVLAFALVIIIIRQEKNLKANLIELTKDVVENTSSSLTNMNENLLGIIESLNELTLLYAKLSNEKSTEEDT